MEISFHRFNSRSKVLLMAGLAALLVLALALTGPLAAHQIDSLRAKTDRFIPAASLLPAAKSSVAKSASSVSGRVLLGLFSHDPEDDLNAKIPSSQWPYVRNMRVGLAWDWIEHKKGKYSWTKADGMINGALRVGVNSILVTICAPVPKWAWNVGASSNPGLAPPKNMSWFKHFCEVVARRYKGYVDFYQIWQEPGYDLDAAPAQLKEPIIYFYGYSDFQYMGLMRAGYQGIKKADPNAYVMTGSLLNSIYHDPARGDDYYNYRVLLAGGNQDISMKVTADRDIVAERPMYFNYHNAWTGGTSEAGIEAPRKTVYLAEGNTYPWNNEWICIQNPGGVDTTVTITYMFPGGSTQDQAVSVPAHSRATVDVNSAVGPNRDVSARLTSPQPIVVERPMYFAYHNAWTGGSDEAAIAGPVKTWYLAEGTTRAGFEEWICLMNPNPAPATVNLTYMFRGGGTQNQTVQMPPTSRQTILVNGVVGPDKDVSTKIESNQPIIAERPMYFAYHNAWTGGHTQVGATAPATSWFLSEGTTRNNQNDGAFEEWISIQNPGEKPSKVDLTYMFNGGGTQAGQIIVGPHSRETIDVNKEVGNDKDVSVQLNSDNPIIVERPMYFNYRNKFDGGHVELGSQGKQKEWYFAEGTTRQGFEEWLTLQNPNAEPANATITYMFGDGTTQNQTVPLLPNSRTTVEVNRSVSIGTIADGVALHPYQYPNLWAEYYSTVQGICSNSGYPNVEAVVSEIGWPHSSYARVDPYWGYTPEGQRRAIGEGGIAPLLAAGCRKIWIYEDMDEPTQEWAGDDSNQGLFDANGNAMPAWNEYKKWQAGLPDFGNKPSHLW